MEKLNKKVAKGGLKDSSFSESDSKTKPLSKFTQQRVKYNDGFTDSSASTIELLRKYVGSDGLLIDNADLHSYSGIMEREQQFGQQLLLLKILVASLNSNDDLALR